MKIKKTRQDHELPESIKEWGWKYHHLGIPTDKIMPDEVYGYLHSADIGIVYYENSFFANNSLSNKIFDYMMAGLPTIAIAMSETKRIIEEVNFGKCYEEIEPRELAMLINRMANDKNLLNNYRKNAINFSQNKYNWKLESKKLINAIDMITTVPLKVE